MVVSNDRVSLTFERVITIIVLALQLLSLERQSLCLFLDTVDFDGLVLDFRGRPFVTTK